VAQEALFAGYGNFGSPGQTYHLGSQYLDRFFRHALLFSQWGDWLGGPFMDAGDWHHVAVTNEGSFVTLDFDRAGVAKHEFNLSTPGGTSFYMGRIPGALGATRRLQGLVDEVSVYNRALSPGEIYSIYAAGSAGKCKEE